MNIEGEGSMKTFYPIFIFFVLSFTACGRPGSGDPLEGFTAETYVQNMPGGSWNKTSEKPAQGSHAGALGLPGALIMATEGLPSGLVLLGESLWKLVIDGDFAADIQSNRRVEDGCFSRAQERVPRSPGRTNRRASVSNSFPPQRPISRSGALSGEYYFDSRIDGLEISLPI